MQARETRREDEGGLRERTGRVEHEARSFMILRMAHLSHLQQYYTGQTHSRRDGKCPCGATRRTFLCLVLCPRRREEDVGIGWCIEMVHTYVSRSGLCGISDPFPSYILQYVLLTSYVLYITPGVRAQRPEPEAKAVINKADARTRDARESMTSRECRTRTSQTTDVRSEAWSEGREPHARRGTPPAVQHRV